MKTINALILSVLTLGSIASPLPAEAERSVTFFIAHNLPEIVAGSPDKTPDVATGPLREGHYTLDQTLELLEPASIGEICFYGSDAVSSMDIQGVGGQIIYGNTTEGGTKRPYVMLSPNYMNPYNPADAPANNGPVKITFHLSGAEDWNVSAIGLESINFDAYRYNNIGGTGASGILSVNGRQTRCPWTRYATPIRVDLPEGERNIRDIVIEAEGGAAVGFRAVTLYLADEPAFTDPDPASGCFDLNPLGEYIIPCGKFGPLSDPTRMGCAIFSPEGKQMEVMVRYDGEGHYILREFGTPGCDSFQPGTHRAAFFIKDNAYSKSPLADDGVPFHIRPEINTEMFTLNGGNVTGNICEVPLQVGIETPSGLVAYNWPSEVCLGGVPEGYSAYWKADNKSMALSGEASPDPRYASLNGSEADIPEGFAKPAPNNKINLSGGNILHLLLAKDGAVSHPVEIHYTPSGNQSEVETPEMEVPSEVSYFDLQGLPVLPGNASGLMIRMERFPDGTCRVVKVNMPGAIL